MTPTSQENIAEKELLTLAKKKIKKRKDFYIHLFIYCIGIVVWLLKTYTNAPLNFLPIRYINCFVMGIWTIFLVIQAIELFVSEIVFGKKWEENKVKNILEDQSEKQTWE